MVSRIISALAALTLWAGIPGFTVHADETNLLNNSSFEVAGSTADFAEYWEAGNPDNHGSMDGNVARVDWDRSRGGTWIAAIMGTWVGTENWGTYWQEVPASPGYTYTFSTWFYADNGWNPGQHGMRLEFYNAATNLLSASTQLLGAVYASWEEKSVQAVAPSNAAWARVVVYATGVSASGALQFDAVSLVGEAPEPPEGPGEGEGPEVIPNTNLFVNPGFEIAGSTTNLAYAWEAGNPDEHGAAGGTALRVNWRPLTGEAHATIRGTWSGAGTGGFFWQDVPAAPSETYEFSAWFWADSNWSTGEQGMKMEFFDAQTNMISAAPLTFGGIGESWVQKSIQAVVPTNAAWVRLVIYADNVGSAGALQFDDLSVMLLRDEPGDSVRTITPSPSSRRTGLVISEIMYNPPDRDDGKNLEFLELYNTTPFTNRLEGYYLTGDVSYAFSASDVIPPFGYLVVAASPSAMQSVYTNLTAVVGPYSGKLPNSSGLIELRKTRPVAGQMDALFLDVEYADTPPWPLSPDGAGHSLVLSRGTYGASDPRAWSASAALGGTPGGPEVIEPNAFTNIVINEVLVHTDEPEYDFIELYNKSSGAIDIGGSWLSDSVKTNKFQIPGGTTIPGRGFVVFFANTNVVSETNLTFALSMAGEDVLFRSPDGTVMDSIRFGAQQNGVSLGRHPDGAADFSSLSNSTPGASNTAIRANTVVINEIMYNPISRNNDDEYIELYNASPGSVDLSDWRLEDGITFRFPSGTTIGSGQYLVVARNASHLIGNYPGVLNAGNTVGNYSGSLANSGERVALVKPDDPLLPEQDFVLVSEVTYRDGGQWGEWSDGGGSSLELMDPRADTRRASNWADSDESQKSQWTLVEYTGKLDHGMLVPGESIDELHVFLERAGEALIDDLEVTRSGGANLVRNPGFESNFNNWTAQGNQKASGRANEGHSGNWSLAVRASGKGDTGANRIKGNLNSGLNANDTNVTIRGYARWLRGDPNLLLRLRGNYLEAEQTLSLPKNLGTPGQANSRKVSNAGPAIWDVVHGPVMPKANESVAVTARVSDPDGIGQAQLRYRIDPSQTIISTNMTHLGGGVYRGIIPGQAGGTLVAFHVAASDSQNATNVFPLGAPEKEALVLFGETANKDAALGAYRFWMTKANLDEWKSREKLSDHYLDMTFVSGERAIYNASVRWRGSPFTRPTMANPDDPNGRASFRVKFPSDEPFLNNDELNIDSLERDRDATMQRERTSYQIAEQLGISYSYLRYVYLSFNGMPYSYVFADVLHIEKDYLQMWFDDEDGELVKIDDWPEFKNFTGGEGDGFVKADATLQNFTTTGGVKKRARYRWNWNNTPKGGNPYDTFANIERLVDAANTTGSVYRGALESVADVPQWMRVIAMRHIIGDWDSYGYKRGKNMSMYLPPNGKWQLIPWDMDFALGADSGDAANSDLFHVESTMPVVKRMTEYAPFRRYYWQALNNATRVALNSSQINGSVDEFYGQLTSDGVSVASPSSIKSYVSDRRSYMANQLKPMTNFNIGIQHVTTNGNLVTLSGSAPVQMYTFMFNGVEYQPEWTSPTGWSVTLAIPTGTTTITVSGFDEAGQQVGPSASRTVSYHGENVSPEGNLVINEIMYQPANGLAEFVELHNRSTNFAFDLTGYRMDGLGFTFSGDAVIGPGEYRVLVENLGEYAAHYTNVDAVIGQYSGKLDNAGEVLTLLRPDGTNEVVVDRALYNKVAPWPEIAAGGGPSLQLIDGAQNRMRVANWAVDTNVLFTPGKPNSVSRSLPTLPELWLNELQVANESTVQDNQGEFDPWVELYNPSENEIALTNFYLTDSYTNLTKWRFPAGSAVDSNGFLVVWLDNEPGQTSGNDYHASFRPALTNGSLALVYSNSGERLIVDYLNYSAIPEDQSYGDYPDGDWASRVNFVIPTPGSPNANAAVDDLKVRINEFMADNKATLRDPDNNKFEDWIELYNYGSNDVDLSGFGFTDNLGKPFKWVFPSGVTIHAGEYLLVWADSANMVGIGVHAGWGLGKGGEDIGLFTPDGDPVDTLSFGAQTSDVSEGRCPDGVGSIEPMAFPTPGMPNCPPPSSSNTPPVLDAIGNKTGAPNALLTFVVSATDTDTPPQTLTYTLDPGAPAGAAINPTTGVFTWTPDVSAANSTNLVTIRVTDDGDGNLDDFETITIMIGASEGGGGEDEPITVRINEWVADNDSILDPDFGSAEDWVELYNYGTNDVDLSGFGFTDKLTNPTKWSFPSGVIITAKSFLVVWADSKNTVGLAPHTSWALGKGGEEIGLFTPDGVPVDTVTFGPQATDVSEGLWPDAGSNIYTMIVTTPGAPNMLPTNNTPPVLAPIGNRSAAVDTLLTFSVSAVDTDEPPQVLTYSLAAGAPAGASIDAETGVFQWTPGESVAGTTNAVTIRVTDDGYATLSDSETILIVVAPLALPNQAPVFGPLGTITVAPGSLLVVQVVAEDPDEPADEVAFALLPPAPPGAAIDPATGVFTWTPDDNFANSTNEIRIVATDDGDPVMSSTGTLTVLVLGMDELFKADASPADLESGTNFVVRWHSEDGAVYRVEAADILPSAEWIALPGDITATGGVAQKEDADAGASEHRFYRIWKLSQ